MFPPLSPADLPAFVQGVVLMLIAWFLGGLIGLQRELRGHAAGMRTHALVAGGACLLSLVSSGGYGGKGDTGRIAAQVVTGIGFLGAGVILRRGVSVHGLTTAASIWLVAGIGIATGAGPMFAAFAAVTTLFTLFTLTVAKRLERALDRRAMVHHGNRVVTVTAQLTRGGGDLPGVLTALTSQGAHIASVETEQTEDTDDAKNDYTTARITLHSHGEALDQAALAKAVKASVPTATIEWPGDEKA